MAVKSYYDSERLINAIKRQAAVPIYQNTFQNQDLLDMANEEIDSSVTAFVMQHHEDYFTVTSEVDLVPGKLKYSIPSRAIGNKLKDVAFKDSSDGSYYEMTRISSDSIPDYRNNVSGTDRPYFFYLENNKVCFAPNSGTSRQGKLVFTFYQRPNRLVENKECGRIVDIDRLNNEVLLDNLPTTFTVNTKMDFIQEKSPHICVAIDQVIVASSSTTKRVKFTTLPEDLEIGDHLAVAEQCMIPQLPSDIHPLLVERVVYRIMSAQGDAQGMQASGSKISELEQKAGNLLDNRVENAPQKIINRHGFKPSFDTMRRTFNRRRY